MRRTYAWLAALCVGALAACGPIGGPAPRVDLRRVAAEVVATAAAQPSPLAEVTAMAAPTVRAAFAPEPTWSPSANATATIAASTAVATATVVPATATAEATATVRSESEAPPTAEPLAGRLEPGGTFRQFAFDYPGDRSVFTVNMHVEPDDAGLLKNAGFVVYGPAAEEIVRGGAQPGRRPNVSADVIHTRPGRYLVLVQNYDPTRPISYRVELVTGPPPGS